MTELSYRILAGDPDARFGQVKSYPGVNGTWRLDEGEPMGDNFPPGVAWSIDEDSGNIVGDFVKNLGDTLIISKAARELLEAEGVTGDTVEYLPLTLKNKRGRVIEDTEYYFANLLRKVDCFDRQKAVFKATKSGSIATIRALQVLTEKVPPDLKAFRLGESPQMILLRSDLVAKIQASSLGGFFSRGLGEDLR